MLKSRAGTSDELVEGEEEPDVLADDRVAVVMLRLEKRPKHAPAPIARLSLWLSQLLEMDYYKTCEVLRLQRSDMN